MIKLVKLELRKNKLSSYLFAMLSISVVCFGFCFMVAVMPQLEIVKAVTPIAIDISVFAQWSNFTMIISILFAMSFAIMSAVMHTKFTVEEYTGKGALLLFSYPQSRSKILFVKCCFVFIFNVLGQVLCNALVVLLFAIISNALGILPTAFEASMMPSLLLTCGVCGMLSAAVGLVAMRVGFWKRSIIVTIVTAVILIAPFSNIISLFPQYSAVSLIISMVVLLIIALITFIGLLAKVNKMEAI